MGIHYDHYLEWAEKRLASRFALPDPDYPVLHKATDFHGFNASRIGHAEYCWDAGQSMLVIELGIFPARNEKLIVEFIGHHELLEHWSKTLSAIRDVGWELHAWNPTPTEHFFHALAVFQRPRA